jgi:TonB family protein
MKPVLFLLALALCGSLARGADKPVVYNSAAAGDTPLDRAIKKVYADQYTIEDISAAAGYVPPKPTAGGLPRTVRNEAGEPLEGKVLVAYIITDEGLVSDPVVLHSSDEELNRTALDAMKEWRFFPGTRKGEPVPTTAAQEFVFALEKSGFETTNIVLYQPDDVLKKRLPGAGHLAAYIQKIQALVTDTLRQATAPGTLVIVTAVRPGGAAKVWLMGSSLDTKTQATLREQAETIPPVEVKEGPVAFAICGTIAGGPEFTEVPPLPPEWKQAAEKLPPPALIPDAVLDKIWPAAP